MTPQIQAITIQILPVLRKAGIKRSSIFGSFARGEETKESDLDLLVELPQGSTLLDLSGLKINLEESLNRKVDVITYDYIHPRLQANIEKDKIDIL